MIQSEQITLCAKDATRLIGTIWSESNKTAPRLVVLINPGMGILASYYERFARYLCGPDTSVLTYDYRGIGASKPQSAYGFDASVEDWGSMDCAAGIDWLHQSFPSAKICVVGHSVGAFLTGFAVNNYLIQKYVSVCGHSAYWRDYKKQVRIPMYLLWHVFMPALTHVVGYFPGRRLHLLEDLPRGVALEWANRRRADFCWNIRDAAGYPDMNRISSIMSSFANLHAPMLAYSFTDDPFGTIEATERLVATFPNCRATHERLSPMQLGQSKIGHFAFFSRRFRDTLWSHLKTWLQS